jgi:hypothetical protein
MRIGVTKCFETDETHELFHFMALLLQNAARHEAGFDVAADGEPREKVGVLKDEAALRARIHDPLRANPKLA